MSKYRGAEIYARKAEEISLVLSEPNVDLWKLRELALSEGGLVNDDLRRMAWPKLAGLHDRLFEDPPEEKPSRGRNKSSRPPLNLPLAPKPVRRSSRSSNHSDDGSVSSTMSSRDKILAICDDFDQIERDVARCTWHLLTGTQRSVSMQMEHKRHKKVAKLIRRKQRRLANLINLTLQQSYPVTDDKLRYFQGYHDVACVILSTLGGSTPVSTRNYSSLESMAASMGLDMPSAVLLQLSQSHFHDCMRANFQQLQTALRLSLFPLIALLDKEVHAHLYQAEMEPFFALSWIITWFSHEIRDTELVKRLFDAFIVGHPLLPLYVSVAMVLHPINRDEILKTECDFSLLHQALQALPRNSSMVGWKYRPGDGYVSDDEATDDDTMASADDIMLEAQVADLSFIQMDDTGTAAPDGVSIASNFSSLLGGAPRVPFQELIETALLYMQRMPPQQLLGLSRRYYGADAVQDMLSQAPDISFFERAPDWCLALTAKADWVLQQRARERKRAGQTRRGRRNEKKRERSRSRSSSVRRRRALPTREIRTEEKEVPKGTVDEHLKKNVKNTAVIAAGFGEWDGHARRKKRRQRNIMYASAVAVAVLAIFWSMSTRNVPVSIGEPDVGEAVIADSAFHSSSSLSSSRPVATVDRVVKEDTEDSSSRGHEDVPLTNDESVAKTLEESTQESLHRMNADSDNAELDSCQGGEPVKNIYREPFEEGSYIDASEVSSHAMALPVVPGFTIDRQTTERGGLGKVPEEATRVEYIQEGTHRLPGRSEETAETRQSNRQGILVNADGSVKFCVCPNAQPVSPWGGLAEKSHKLGEQIKVLRTNVIGPKIKSLKKATKRFAHKANEELHDLPEPKFKQFVDKMWDGAKQRRGEIASHLKKDGIIRTRLRNLRAAIGRKIPPQLALRMKKLLPLLQKLLREFREKSGRFLVNAQHALEDSDAHKAFFIFKYLVEHVRSQILVPKLEKVPFASIRMVQRMCRSGGKWYKLDTVPFFCREA